ncbi:MarR family winged helix-turn-helix transcriptional regulator [Secundilactobacillus silagincola]|uniref:MarR family winged helix-turn-helix transcriptional regulator n=1 Tax=Secundilactobacillus silagincola TaxID=1714681 RepID=UPI000BFC7E94|nr:MarR family transcriptional regulator [Secundilactobacillus silagincola]
MVLTTSNKYFDADFVQQVAVLNLVITNHITEMLAPYEVNASNYFYVMKISENPGITRSDFNQLVHLNHSSITRAVNHLIEKGLIKQSINPRDKRGTQLFLTDKGIQLNREITQKISELNANLMAKLEPQQQTIFSNIVKLRQSIERDYPE